MKPATLKARELLAKLERLAERGVDGERTSALRQVERLKKRYDFTKPVMMTGDIFAGIRNDPSSTARHVTAFTDLDIGNAVKWAIESATGIRCAFRGPDLWAECGERTARRLDELARQLAESFGALWTQLRDAGINPADRNVFIMGLYDGMMNEVRELGQRLPTRAANPRLGKTKKRALSHAPGLNLHPYAIALPLGKDIRFSVPIEEVRNRLADAVKGALTV